MKFSCPHCGQHIEAEENWAGIETNCPTCSQKLTIPHASSEPPPTALPTFANSITKDPQARPPIASITESTPMDRPASGVGELRTKEATRSSRAQPKSTEPLRTRFPIVYLCFLGAVKVVAIIMGVGGLVLFSCRDESIGIPSLGQKATGLVFLTVGGFLSFHVHRTGFVFGTKRLIKPTVKFRESAAFMHMWLGIFGAFIMWMVNWFGFPSGAWAILVIIPALGALSMMILGVSSFFCAFEHHGFSYSESKCPKCGTKLSTWQRGFGGATFRCPFCDAPIRAQD